MPCKTLEETKETVNLKGIQNPIKGLEGQVDTFTSKLLHERCLSRDVKSSVIT